MDNLPAFRCDEALEQADAIDIDSLAVPPGVLEEPEELHPAEEGQVLIPARKLNEFVYCKRLGYLEWVESEFQDNFFTEDGRYRHRRVDAQDGYLPEPSERDDALKVRSVMLSAVSEGLVARIDMVEAEGSRAHPVDYKRGVKRPIDGGVYDPERVQLCAQGLILRENGWDCDGGWIYYTESKERVWVPFDEELVQLTRTSARELRELSRTRERPPPLVNSPKCNGCSLNAICLPDEVTFLQEAEPEEAQIRRLISPRPEAVPLYLQKQGAFVGIKGLVLEVKEKSELLGEVRLIDTSQVTVMGNVQLSTQAIRELCQRGIPVCFFSYGGWFYGMATGLTHKNVLLRQEQFRTSADKPRCLEIARSIVSNKILNCRTLLRRNQMEPDDDRLLELKRFARSAEKAETMASLLGIEGMGAKVYFQAFKGMLKQSGLDFDFNGRNRRPPRDPINAMLSFGYAMLTKDLTVAAQAAGFDPYQGFYHQPKYGRPALALDLMEIFRPLIVDSTVIWCVNNGVVKPKDFVVAGQSAALTPAGRRAFLDAYERRMEVEITHPTFGYRISYRRVLDVHTRLVARYLSGEIPRFPTFRTR